MTESQIEDRQGRLDALARDAALLAPPNARAASDAEEPLAAPRSFTPPTPGKISVRFGGRLQSGLLAQGVAYRPAPGAEVVSPATAVVEYAGPVNGWGEVVILRGGGGCHMVLSGLGKVTVAAGQLVAGAGPIGAMPTLGQPPPELYFELRLARGVVDPARMMISRQATLVNATSAKLRRKE
jgi:murein hydrolase activator